MDEATHTSDNAAALTRAAVMAREQELARVSRDLHDGLGQLITATLLDLAVVEKHIGVLPTEVVAALERAVQAVDASAHELRWICRGLGSAQVAQLGLKRAAESLLQDHAERTGTRVHFEMDADEEFLDDHAALCIFRVLQESLGNISRHACASCVDVGIRCCEKELVLSVSDNGSGFDPGNVGEHGSGIAGMRERASLVGGQLEVVSINSGVDHGTKVLLRIPIVSRCGGEDGSEGGGHTS